MSELATSLGLGMEAVPCALTSLELNETSSPSDQFVALRRVCKTLNLGDSGSGVHGVSSTKYAVPGTIRANTTAIATANGIVVPPTKCTARLPYRTSDGRHCVQNSSWVEKKGNWVSSLFSVSHFS